MSNRKKNQGRKTIVAGPNDQEHIQWLAELLVNGDVMRKFGGEWRQDSELEMHEGITSPGYLRRIIRLKTLGLVEVDRCRSLLGGYQIVRLTRQGQVAFAPVVAAMMAEAVVDRDNANAENAAKVAEYRATLSRFTITYPDGTTEDVEGPTDTLNDVLAEVKAEGYTASNIRKAA